jgi:hypothetical protein
MAHTFVFVVPVGGCNYLILVCKAVSEEHQPASSRVIYAALLKVAEKTCVSTTLMVPTFASVTPLASLLELATFLVTIILARVSVSLAQPTALEVTALTSSHTLEIIAAAVGLVISSLSMVTSASHPAMATTVVSQILANPLLQDQSIDAINLVQILVNTSAIVAHLTIEMVRRLSEVTYLQYVSLVQPHVRLLNLQAASSHKVHL